MFQFQAASSLPARATASAEDKSTTTPLTFNFNPLELSSVSPFPTAIPIRATELKDNKPISAPPVFKFKPLEPLSTVPVFTGLPMSPSAQPSKLADAAASHPNLDKHTALEIRTMPGAAFASPSTGSEDSGSEGESNGDSSTSSRSNGSLPEDTNHEGLAASIFSPLPTTAATHEKRSLTNTPQAQISTSKPDFVLHSQLLVKNGKGTKAALKRIESDIENTPLLSGTIVEAHSHDFVSQYGLLGCLDDQDPSLPASQIFLNIAAPFSTFICGVQGSGKSHTTSCILENALIPSRKLGQLKSPASTLVFNYGAWSNGGAGFNISEATYLATASKGNKGHSVKRITVLTSPSNPAINKLYQRHPNVRIIPFRLKACTLDIGVLAKLMAVDEKAAVPLYMARVQAILRDSATNSEKGSLDYKLFNKRLQRERFDPKQKNMLEMRLNLLESFLDLSNTAKEPDFLPGEITIMDLSDAFITPSTACVLFKIGLERFIESKALAKMVVLDEAHKVSLDPSPFILTLLNMPLVYA
jgi:hypothetical protein